MSNETDIKAVQLAGVIAPVRIAYKIRENGDIIVKCKDVITYLVTNDICTVIRLQNISDTLFMTTAGLIKWLQIPLVIQPSINELMAKLAKAISEQKVAVTVLNSYTTMDLETEEWGEPLITRSIMGLGSIRCVELRHFERLFMYKNYRSIAKIHGIEKYHLKCKGGVKVAVSVDSLLQNWGVITTRIALDQQARLAALKAYITKYATAHFVANKGIVASDTPAVKPAPIPTATIPSMDNIQREIRELKDVVQSLITYIKQVVKPELKTFDPSEEMGDNHWHSLQQTAKVLNYPYVGRNKLANLLRQIGWLTLEGSPTQRVIDAGYAKLVSVPYVNAQHQDRLQFKPLISKRGVEALRRIIDDRRAAGEV